MTKDNTCLSGKVTENSALDLKRLYFFDSRNILKFEIIAFSDFAHLIMLFIGIAVLGMIISFLVTKFRGNKLTEQRALETVWTLAPCVVLILLAFPRLSLLYVRDSPGGVSKHLRVVGRQWYWTYDIGGGAFDSYIDTSGYRLLDVDLAPVIKTGVKTQALISRGDVLHRWAVPALGVKVDAVPGRINRTIVDRQLVGKVYGQCSEICGANHSFIPIVLERII